MICELFWKGNFTAELLRLAMVVDCEVYLHLPDYLVIDLVNNKYLILNNFKK